MIDAGRKADIEYLLSRRQNPMISSGERKDIDRTIERISLESKEVRDMREALIRATRDNNLEEIKDIHQIVKYRKQKRRYGWTE